MELLDWRRRVHELYGEVRAGYRSDPEEAHQRWLAGRQELVGRHPQSPLDEEARARFRGLDHFPYDPALAFTARVEEAEQRRYELPTSSGGAMAFVRFGRVRLAVGTLDLYWLDAYGDGLFLPFRDTTADRDTYGGGRYLLDTVKGADLGSAADGELVLDFNFAYNPSCHYRSDWTCPLPPPDNWLD
ncbi:MAG TPA: DUF1684 domain-containing protein, partial [Egibacteraceae bacterium]|nr:DUF1684 domain-containing protein [Egibacteraceae bacterium]